jgi:hypothetical protein
MTLRPTHTCFDDVLDHQAELRGRDLAAAHRQLIVHGILLAPEGPHEGEPFAHAWVEDPADNRIYQSALLDDGTKVWWSCAWEEFERLMRPQHVTRYSLERAYILNWQTEHFGPWVPAYRALCNARGEAKVFQSDPPVSAKIENPAGRPAGTPTKP